MDQTLELNKVYHMDNREGINLLPEKSANLIIADPPYFEVKGEFDFVWKSFDEYLEFMEDQAKLYKRILADNGTLFVWGMDRKIPYIQVIFDKYFQLYSSLVWEKPSIANEWDTRRTFPERGQERLLMYGKEEIETGLERLMEEEIKPRHPFAIYLKEEFKKANVSNKKIAALFPSKTGGFTGCVSNWLNGDNVPTEDQYLKMRNFFNGQFLIKEYENLKKEYENLRKEFEALRNKYEDLRRPFNNYLLLTDVLRFPRAYNAIHPTQKPEDLTRALILTCSRENDLVVVPFAGSGTECAMSAKEGRKFIGFETNEKYVKMSNKRIWEHQSQLKLI
jgi:DNA modification methylase